MAKPKPIFNDYEILDEALKIYGGYLRSQIELTKEQVEDPINRGIIENHIVLLYIRTKKLRTQIHKKAREIRQEARRKKQEKETK